MYKRDVTKILTDTEQGTPEDLLAVITFVLLTVRMPFSRTGKQAKDVAKNKDKAKSLWGFKAKGYHHAVVHSSSLYDNMVASRSDVDHVLYELLLVPGLGLPKASFVAQCLGYDTACLDSHNLKRMGYPVSITKTKTNVNKSIDEYLKVVQEKGTEWYWNTWCEYVAGNRHNKSLGTADEVSAYHYTCIKTLGEQHGT